VFVPDAVWRNEFESILLQITPSNALYGRSRTSIGLKIRDDENTGIK
jgi:hypothetical protein